MLFHPSARLGIHAGDRLLGEDLEVEAAPGPPLRIRFVAEGGEPLEGLFLRLMLAKLEIPTNTLVLARGATAAPWPFRTNERGEAVLVGVDPNSPLAVEVLVGSGKETERVSVGGLAPGEVQEVVYSP